MIYVPGQFRNECDTAIRVFQSLSVLLNEHKVDEADAFMASVMTRHGVRIYEAVLAMVAASRGIPPKDVPR